MLQSAPTASQKSKVFIMLLRGVEEEVKTVNFAWVWMFQ